ncbi:hypothetical protein [Niabella soli]|uniref:Uncharacterized protein n=1 Tax=Niabella soli DSM 19437 TaxID=929713 RepID=W0F929_9BACT|nr:hypothetical protein [Niabella soli]AHF17881.1 hypothetical protein NIASO_16010 [Niabella soli DSM 19437]
MKSIFGQQIQADGVAQITLFFFCENLRENQKDSNSGADHQSDIF